MGLLIDNKIPQDLIIAGKIVSSIYVNSEKIWPEEVKTNYLTFTALGDIDSQISIKQFRDVGNNKTFEYNLNDSVWTTYNIGDIINLSPGNKVQFRSNDNLPMSSNTGYRYFNNDSSGIVECSGSVASLMNNDTTMQLPSYCFKNLFNYFDNMNSLPELPWTNLGDSCYEYMFTECTGLTNIPEGYLPATTLAPYCYADMFSQCSGISSLPNNLLPATTLTSGCYEYMFQDCTSLTTAPELPATTLADYCYCYMFNGCTNLTTGPEILPATELTESCYENMFSYCSSLTTGPDLPAEKIEIFAYDSMFSGCSSLSSIKCNAMYDEDDNILENYIADYWMEDVKNTSECIFYKNPNWTGPTERGDDTVQSEWQIVDWEAEPKYLKFTVLSQDPSTDHTIRIESWGTNPTKIIKYRKNNGTWTTYFTSIPVEVGDTVEFMSENNIPMSSSTANYRKIGLVNVRCKVEGDLMSLVNFKHNPSNYGFYQILAGEQITTTPMISKVDAGEHEFTYAFYHCDLLTEINNISFNSVRAHSCSSMFDDCYRLNSINKNMLANVTMDKSAEGCFTSMFRECRVLQSIPEGLLPNDNLPNYCYSSMFSRCYSLVNVPDNLLPATSLGSHCYDSMFEECTGLTNVPELNSDTLASGCYENMFKGCTSLNINIPLTATNLKSRCYWGMFWGCTSLTTAPELPATTLAEDCYNYMFYNCPNINTIKSLAIYDETGVIIDTIGSGWLQGVSETGTYYKNPNWSGPTYRNSSTIPEGWDIVDWSSESKTYKFDLGTGKYYNEAGAEISDLGVFTLADGITYGTYSFAQTSADQETYKFNACEENYNTTTITEIRDMYVINKDINITVVECVFFRAGTNTGGMSALGIGDYYGDYVENYRCSSTYSSSNYGGWPDLTQYQPGEVSSGATIKMLLNARATNKSYGMYGTVTFEM